MLLSPGNKSGDIFNFYLQKSIARWKPSYILLMPVNLFTDLSMVTTNICGVLLEKISVICFKNNEKYSLYFYYHFSFFIYIFFNLGNTPRVKSDTYLFERPVLSQNTWKHMKKTKYTFPSSWNNLIHGGRAAKISRQHKHLEKRKNWYQLNLASTY